MVNELAKVNQWLCTNRLSINHSKTNSVVFSTYLEDTYSIFIQVLNYENSHFYCIHHIVSC